MCQDRWQAPQFSVSRKIGKYCTACRGNRDSIERYGIAYEAVNPRVVFERGCWMCFHCYCDLPKHLRGTLAPNAPTLDHILPRAKGGAHSYANTQPLCRACNSKKQDSIEREPLLKGVTDFTCYLTAKIPATVLRDPRSLEVLDKNSKPVKRFCKCGCCSEIKCRGEWCPGHWSKVHKPSGFPCRVGEEPTAEQRAVHRAQSSLGWNKKRIR